MDILTTKFELDVSPFLKAIKTAVDAASKLLDLKPTVDTDGLQDLANQIQGIDTSIDVGVNIDSGSLDQISETVSNLDTTAFVNIQADTSSLDQAQQEVDQLTQNESAKIKLNTDDSEVKQSQEEVKELNQDIKDIPNEKKVNIDVNGDKVNSAIGGITGKFGGLASFVSGAVGGALATVATNAIRNFGEAGNKADELGDNLEIAFSQAGVADVNAEIERTNQFAAELSDQFAISSDESKALLAGVVSLSGQTGQAAEDTTKLALGIEKASGGIVSAEQAAKLLAKGIADPESQAQLDALAKKFPQLKDALSSTAPLADKAKQGLDALGNTFDTLEAQAQGPDAALAKIQDRLNVASQAIGGAFLTGIAPALNQLVPLIGQLTTAIQPVLEQLGGQLAGALGNLATEVFPVLVDALTPIIDTLGSVLPPIIDVVVSALANLLPVISQIFSTLGPLVGQLLGALAPVLGDILKVIADLAGRIIQALLPIITKVFEVITKLLPVLSPIIDALGDTLGPIIDTIGELLQAILIPLLPLIEVLVQALAPILEVVVRVLGILINAGLKVMIPLFKTLGGTLSFVGNLFNAVAGFAQKVSGWFTKLINDNPILKRVFDAVKTAIQNLLGLLPDFIKEALGMKNANTQLAKSSQQAADDGAKQGKSTQDLTNKTKDNTDKTKDNTKAKGANSKATDKQVESLNKIKEAYDKEKKAIEDKKNAALIALDEQRLAEGRLTESIDDKLKKQEIERKATQDLSNAQINASQKLTEFQKNNTAINKKTGESFLKVSADAAKSFDDLTNTVSQAGNEVRKQFTAQGFAELQFRVDLDQKALADTLAGIDKNISTAAKNFGIVFSDQSALIGAAISGTTSTIAQEAQKQVDVVQGELKKLTEQQTRLQAIVDIDVSPEGIANTRKRYDDLRKDIEATQVQIQTETDPQKLAELQGKLKELQDQQVVLTIALDPEKRAQAEASLESVGAKIEETTAKAEELGNKIAESLNKTKLDVIPIQVDVELPDLEPKQREIEIAFRKSVEEANQAFEKEFADLEKLYDQGKLTDQEFFNATTALQNRRTEVVKKASDERTKALQEEASAANGFIALFDSIGRNLEAALFPKIEGVPEGTKNALDEQYKLLKTQLELQLITYEDYNKAVLDIETKRTEEQTKIQEEARKKQLEAIRQIGSDALPKFNEAFAKSNEELTKTLQKGGASIQEIGDKSLEVLAATSGQALALALQNAQSLDEIGKQFAKQLVSGLLNVLQAQLQAAIIGAIFTEAQQKGALGLAVGAAVGAALTALFAAAKAKINAALGFEKGGYTGDKGTKEVAGVVHGQEYVVNAKATKKNRKALEFINSSNGSFEQFIDKQFGNRIFNIEKAIDGLQFQYNHEGIIKGIVEKSMRQTVFNNESIRNYNQTKVANYVDTSTMSTSINGLAMTMDSRMASMERTIDTAIRQNATLTRSAQQLDVKVASDPGSSITWLRKQGKINSNR